ncbi:MAG: autotransporter-associated beta strand repeat-containing protein [Kiritimatiellae bacterium]|nr:autotransporter-associated beta strand repeat-containing protein [Kiritimatiellia bacterium]
MLSKKMIECVAMCIGVSFNMVYATTTNTWDADISTSDAQDGSGTWNTSNSNWWHSTEVNTNWNNSALPDQTIFGVGSDAAGTITLGDDITVGNLRFDAPGSGSYTLDGNGNTLNFGIINPLLWVSSDVTVTNFINSNNTTRDLNVTGGGSFVFAGTNTFHSIDVMDSATAWYGIDWGIAGTTITIPSNASFTTTGYPPINIYATFGVRLRDDVTLNINGKLTTSARIGCHSGEQNIMINVNTGAVVTTTSEIRLGWNSAATLNINGGLLTANGILHMDGNTGVVNLNSGTLATTRITTSTGSGAFNVNYNGGLLKAQSDSLLTENSTKNYVTTYFVKDGGAVIDTNNKNIEAIGSFNKSGSGGLTKQGAGNMIFSGGTYSGMTTVTDGTLNLNFNKRTSQWNEQNIVSDFYNRNSKLILNGGDFTVTGLATASSVTRDFTVDSQSTYTKCVRGSSTTDLVAGMSVSGPSIPADTHITYINDASQFIMSKANTIGASATESLTFGGVTNTTWQTINNIELQQDATITVDTANGPGTVLTVGSITGAGNLTKDGDGILTLTGTNTYSGNTLIQEGTLKLSASIVVTNNSFELHDPLTEHPPYGYFDSNPANSFWDFYFCGIAEHGSTWASSNAVIDGSYVAFIQANTMLGTATTTLNLPENGEYVISFMAGKRPTTGATAINVLIDGNTNFTFASSEFQVLGSIYTGIANLSAGSHTLTFEGVMTGTDRSTWIDRVLVTSLAGGGLVDTLPTDTAFTVKSDGVLDLGGNTQTLAELSGDGVVTNGILAISNKVMPGETAVIGTLTLATSTTLTGTLLADTSVSGTCDLLKVQGSLNLTGSTLQIQDLSELKTDNSYVIATCTPGTLTGEFDTTNFDTTPWHVVYDNAAGEVRVEIIGGTLILVH